MADVPNYFERREAFYQFLSTLAEDSGALERILVPFAEASPTMLGRVRGFLRAGTYAVQKAGYVYDYYTFYKPEASKLQKIITGNAVHDPIHPNFFIEVLKDEATKDFLRNNSQILSILIDKLAPHILDIVLKNIRSQPDTDGLKKLLGRLQKNKFDDAYIRENILPKMVEVIKKTLKEPEKNLDWLNWRLAILSGPETTLSKNTFAFAKKAEAELRNLFGDKAVLRLLVAYLSSKPKNYEAILQDLATILNRPEWKTIFEGIPEFLNTNKKDLQEVILSHWEETKRGLGLPMTLSKEFAKDFMDLSIDWSRNVLPLVFNFFKAGLKQEQHAALIEIFSLYTEQQAKAKALPQAIKVPETSVKASSAALYPFIVPQFLIALRQNGVDMKVIFEALNNNMDLLLEISKSAANIAVREVSTEHKVALIKSVFDLAFNSEQPFIRALGTATSEQLAQAIIDTPILGAELAKLGIEAPLIIGTVPILRRAASIILNHKPEIKGIIQYYYNATSTETDLKLVQDIASIAQDTFLDAHYLMDNKDRILTLVDMHFNFLREKVRLPDDFSKEFVKDTLNLGINLSQDLLPFVGDLTQAILRDKNHDLIVTIMDKARKVAKAQGENQESTAIDSLLESVLKLDDNEIIRAKLPNILKKHSEPLGKLIDQFLSQTKMGKKVYIDTSEFLRVASDHVPKLKLISELYLKKDKMWVWKAASLLSDKKVLAFVLKTLFRLIAHKLNPQKPSLETLTKKLDLFFKENAGTKMMDVGYWLEKESEKTGTAMNRNFKGVNFSEGSQKLSFSGCILKGFNFDKAKLKNFSFENSVIKNCSFEGVKFIGKPNFKGVKIDQNSFNSLQRAIAQYNLKHQSNPIGESEMPTMIRPS